MLAEGRGSPVDLSAARAWFLRAAEQHNADAETAAGEMLINGRGGPPDRSMAIFLFNRAAATGHPAALFALNVLRGAAQNGASSDQCLAA
jgi:TPR repeat protein